MKPSEVVEVRIIMPCKNGNHEVVLKVEKSFDSMCGDSDFALVCDDNKIKIIFPETEGV